MDPYAAIPPVLRRTPRTAKSRRLYAFLGFLAAYIVLPALFLGAIYALNAHATAQADRADAFYQQTAKTPLQ